MQRITTLFSYDATQTAPYIQERFKFRECALYAEVPCSTEIMVMVGAFWKQNLLEIFLFDLFICWAKQALRQLVSTREICLKRGLHLDCAAPFTPNVVAIYLTFQLSRFLYWHVLY